MLNEAIGKEFDVFYWSGRNCEVDFVVRRGKTLVAIEVKSGRAKRSLPGVEAFSREFPVSRKLLVGEDGMPLGEFLETPPQTWLE